MTASQYYVFTFLICMLSACNVDDKEPNMPKNKESRATEPTYTKPADTKYTKPVETKSAEIATNQINTDTLGATYSDNVPIATVMPENDTKIIADTLAAPPQPKTKPTVGVDSYNGTLIITIPNIPDAAAIQHFIILNPALTSIIGKDEAASEHFTKGKATINVVAHNESYTIPKKSKFIVGKEYIAKVSAGGNVNQEAQQVKFKYSKKYAQINIILASEERSVKDSLNVQAKDTDGGVLKFQYIIENTSDKNHGNWIEYSVLDAATKPVTGLCNLRPAAATPYYLIIDPKKYKLAKGQYYLQFVFQKDNIKTKKNIKFTYKGQSTICVEVTTRTLFNIIAKEIAKLNANDGE